MCFAGGLRDTEDETALDEAQAGPSGKFPNYCRFFCGQNLQIVQRCGFLKLSRGFLGPAYTGQVLSIQPLEIFKNPHLDF